MLSPLQGFLARETLVSLHRNVEFPEASPWRERRDAVARLVGPDGSDCLEQGRVRGFDTEIKI